MIAISALTVDPQIQLAARGIRDATVAAYVEALSSGSEFPAITVYDDSKVKWVSDGFHRLEAHRFLGLGEIQADVRGGTHQDAMIHAALANVTNGEPMSQAQKREAGERLLRMTDWSDYEIARKLAVGQASVWRWRQSLSNSNELDNQDTRTVTRSGTTYTMDVSSIGRPTVQVDEDRAAFYQRWAEDNRELGFDQFGDPIQRPRPHISQATGNNEWYTPPEYAEAALEVLGQIDLDPASTPEANAVIGARDIYTIQEDGLQMPWHGRVFMNPPYSSDLIHRFASKLRQHVLDGSVAEAIVLVNNATETGWFQSMAAIAQAICFPSSRIKFWGPDGEVGSPLQGQAILYFGPNATKFSERFLEFGVILWRMMKIGE